MKYLLMSGNFDCFNLGYLSKLENEHKIIVGVYSDYLILKKTGKLPIMPLYQRVELVKSLKNVCSVFVEDDDSIESKLKYSEYYNACCFTLEEEYLEAFKSLNRQKEIKEVVYFLPNLPNKTYESGYEYEYSSKPFKPRFSWECRYNLKVLVSLDNLLICLPFLNLFNPENIYWDEYFTTRDDLEQFGLYKIGKWSQLIDISDINLVITNQYVEILFDKPHLIINIIDNNYNLELISYQVNKQITLPIAFSLSVCYKNETNCLLSGTKQSQIDLLWQLNQRLMPDLHDRKNILIELSPDNLKALSNQIIKWTESYNIVVIPDQKETSISYPNSTLNYLFQTCLDQKNSAFMNILSREYFVYYPNFYLNCDLIITDKNLPIALEIVSNIYYIGIDYKVNNIDTDIENLLEVENKKRQCSYCSYISIVEQLDLLLLDLS